MNPRLLTVLIFASLWPVWTWMATRLSDKSDDPFGLMAMIAAAALCYYRSKAIVRRHFDTIQILLICGALLGYAATAPFLPMLVRAGFAMLAVTLTLSWVRLGTRFNLAIFGLCLLSLPVVATLQFYFGHPLRLIVAHGAQFLLFLCGYITTLSGTDLLWHDQVVGIAPACSGIKMLWTGAFAVCVLAAVKNLNTTRTLILSTAALPLILIANTLRATTLFLLQVISSQSHLTEPAWLHSGVGIVLFLSVVFIITIAADKLTVGTDLPVRPQRLSRPDSNPPSRFISTATTLLIVFIALLPITSPTTASPHTASSPRTIPFRGLTPVPLTATEQSFAANFPGTIGKYTDGTRQFIVRTVYEPTRQLHPAEDCFRGSGFATKSLPNFRDEQNHTWGSFEASKSGVTLMVHERISDDEGNTWTDVSSWYWSCAFNKTRGPWLSVTVAEPIATSALQAKNTP